MKAHQKTERFKSDSFTVTILEESESAYHISTQEEYWIKELDTFHNGLNESWSGKGYGHNSPDFTTRNYKFTEKQRANMSKAAKARAKREGHDVRSQNSKKGWEAGGEEYRKYMSDIRKGKRLHNNLKLSDSQVADIRKRYEKELSMLTEEAEQINNHRQEKNRSWKLTNAHSVFAEKYSSEYGVTKTLIRNILTNKMRTKALPNIHE